MTANLKIAATGAATRTLAVHQAFPLTPGEIQDTPDPNDKLPSYNDQNHLVTYGGLVPTKGGSNR